MDDIAHIVALSGGKDSSAMAMRLAEIKPRNYIYFCTPTGDELPDMEDHWQKLSRILKQPILRLRDPDYPTIYDLIDHFQMLPNWRARWCTRILKIETAQQFYNLVKPAVIYVGLRADEEKRQGNKLYDADIKQVFPMQEWGWGIKEVQKYLREKGITIPRRTDCAMCFYQRIGEWWDLWKYYPDYFKKVADLEDKIKYTLMSPGKHKNWPHKLSDLSNEFKKGRVPRGANSQMDLFNDSSKCRVCSL
ncbi:MAG: phosphoadenosine phosphosulfate reductase family protein [Bacteroidetes bacterium]|nr:phosphoadenosine phosphosulfate reductase family protein [Bacteroidota bacterium]